MPFLEYGAATSLAAASEVLKGYDDPLAKECLDTAINSTKRSRRIHAVRRAVVRTSRHGCAWRMERRARTLIATNGGEIYKKRVVELFPTVRQHFRFWWMDGRARPALHGRRLQTAARRSRKNLQDRSGSTSWHKTPFGVPPSLRSWGGSSAVAQLGYQIYFLHKAFPQIVGPEYTLRAANYILGTHPVSSTSYVSAVGTVSKMKAYGNNRADNTFIPGGVIPGYIVIKPDFPECIDDFGFLWFEDEYVINVASDWVLAANAADAIVREGAGGQEGMK